MRSEEEVHDFVHRIATFFATLLLTAGTIWYFFQFKELCIDDAGISFVYARNLASGYGLVFHPSMIPVEGYSNPLWVLILSLFYALGFTNLVIVSKILSALFLLAAGYLCLYICIEKGLPRLLFALIWLNPYFHYWGASGMENALFSLLFVLLLCNSVKRSSIVAQIVCVLFTLARPEGLFYGLLALLTTEKPWRVFKTWLAAVLVLTGFRLIVFHDVLPNTLWAKAGLIHSTDPWLNMKAGWRYWLVFFKDSYSFAYLGVLLFFYVLWKQQWLASCILLFHLLFLLCCGGDWMSFHRFTVFVYPVFSIALCYLLGDVFSAVPELFVISGILFFNYAGYEAFQWKDTLLKLRQPYMQLSPRIERGKLFAKKAKELGINSASLLDPDGGGTAWGTDLIVWDMAGLTNKEIGKSAQSPDSYRSFLKKVRPDFIYIAGDWLMMTKLHKASELFQMYQPLDGGTIWFKPPNNAAHLVRRDLAVSAGEKTNEIK